MTLSASLRPSYQRARTVQAKKFSKICSACEVAKPEDGFSKSQRCAAEVSESKCLECCQ